MIKILASAAVVIFMTGIAPARADSLESETSGGALGLSENLTYRFSSNQKDSIGGKWEGSADYTYSNSTQTDSISGASITDTSQAGTFELGYKNTIEVGGGYTYGITPAESLKQYGPSAYLGLNFSYGAEPEKKKPANNPPYLSKDGANAEDADEDDDDFRPGFSLKLKAARTTYNESFSATARNPKVARALAAAENLDQTSAELDFGWDPLEWLSLGLGYTRYNYDKDVSRFMTFLDSPLAIRLVGASGFSDTLSGFFSRSYSGTLTLRPGQSWEVATELSQSESAIDGSLSPSQKITVAKDLNATWTIGVGAEHGISSGLVSNTAIAQLVYHL